MVYWSDDLDKVVGKIWMRAAKDITQWHAVQEADDDDGGSDNDDTDDDDNDDDELVKKLMKMNHLHKRRSSSKALNKFVPSK